MSEDPKDFEHQWMELQGRLCALEAVMVQLTWMWALDRPHPPTALADFLRPLEQGFQAMAEKPGNHPVQMQAANIFVKNMAETLERLLHAEALRRTETEGRRPS